MDFLSALGGVEDDAADFRTGHALDVGVADLIEVLPGCVLGGAGGGQFDDCVVFRGGVVDGCDGSVGKESTICLTAICLQSMKTVLVSVAVAVVRNIVYSI